MMSKVSELIEGELDEQKFRIIADHCDESQVIVQAHTKDIEALQHEVKQLKKDVKFLMMNIRGEPGV